MRGAYRNSNSTFDNSPAFQPPEGGSIGRDRRTYNINNKRYTGKCARCSELLGRENSTKTTYTGIVIAVVHKTGTRTYFIDQSRKLYSIVYRQTSISSSYSDDGPYSFGSEVRCVRSCVVRTYTLRRGRKWDCYKIKNNTGEKWLF